jgi:uncharacterized RDD family membrane protein YckC
MYRRIAAFLIDSLIVLLCFAPVWIQMLGSYLREGALIVPLSWLGMSLLLQLFYKWLFLYFLGGTLGKLMMGLRVVPSAHPDQDLGLFQSLLRVLTDALSFFFGQALRALALVRLDRTHVSDWVAETRVVQLAPRSHPPTRHWVLALIVILISFSNQFHRAYQLVQNSELVDGEIIFDAIY